MTMVVDEYQKEQRANVNPCVTPYNDQSLMTQMMHTEKTCIIKA